MPVNVYQNVLGFDVAIDNILGMKVLESEEQLSKIESCLFLCELLNLSKMKEHLAAGAQIHHKKQFGLRLK